MDVKLFRVEEIKKFIIVISAEKSLCHKAYLDRRFRATYKHHFKNSVAQIYKILVKLDYSADRCCIASRTEYIIALVQYSVRIIYAHMIRLYLGKLLYSA